MTELIEGATYVCADGAIRRLRKIEPRFLTYDVLIKRATWTFRSLGQTHRHQVERDFTNGEIIEAPEGSLVFKRNPDLETFVDDEGRMTHRLPGIGRFPGRMSLADELAAEAEADKERGDE